MEDFSCYITLSLRTTLYIHLSVRKGAIGALHQCVGLAFSIGTHPQQRIRMDDRAMHIYVITPNNVNPSATPSKDRGTAAAQQTDPNEFHQRANFRDLVTAKATRSRGSDHLQTGRITRSSFRGRTKRTRGGFSSRHQSQGITKRGLFQNEVPVNDNRPPINLNPIRSQGLGVGS